MKYIIERPYFQKPITNDIVIWDHIRDKNILKFLLSLPGIDIEEIRKESFLNKYLIDEICNEIK